jgi:uncharacterized membrane protein
MATTAEKPKLFVHQWTWGLMLIMALGTTLRLAGANVQSFWYDEAVTAQLSRASAANLLTGEARDNGNPPLYWLIAKVAGSLWGDSEFSYRLPSIFFGVISIPAIGFLGNKLVSPQVGLFAAALLSFSPFSLELSTEARAYSLFHLLAIVNTICFLSWTECRGRSRAFLYLLTTSCLCLTHYYAIVIPIIHGLSLLFIKSERKLLSAWAGLVAMACLICSFWGPAFFHQLATPGNLTRHGESWYIQFLATPLAFALGRTFVWRDQSLLLLASATFVTIVTFWLLVGSGLKSILSRPKVFVLLAAWLVLPIVVPGLAALLGKPLYHIRAGSVALPAFFLLAGAGLDTLRQRSRIVLCVILGTLVIVSTIRFFTFPLKDDWRSATPAILATRGSDEAVVFDTDIEVVSFAYYASRLGRLPDPMFTVTSGVTSDRSLLAKKYQCGKLVRRKPENMTDEILAEPGVCLVLCVPVTQPEDYVRFFCAHGFVVDRTLRFKRIEIIHLRRRPSGTATPRI